MPPDICPALDETSRENGFLNSLRTVELPEEFYFQTLVMHLGYAHRVVPANPGFSDRAKGG